jgi:serine/threonine-protein kinase
MGAVYRAARVEDGAIMALKLVSDEYADDPKFMQRFEREGRLAAGLKHPHLVEVHEAGTWEGVPYLAMTFVEGIDLACVIASQGALHPATAARIVTQIGSALDAVHADGLVHRDVKPSNVLLERKPAGVHAYLSDFGLSKHVDSASGLTRTGHWVGTIDYAAPEQLQAADTDARTDVYGLGCVLYEALTGVIPYPAKRDVDKVIARISAPPPSVTEHGSVRREFDSVIRGAMAVRPDERFQTAGELAQAASAAAQTAGPEPAEPIRFQSRVPPMESDAPTAA